MNPVRAGVPAAAQRGSVLIIVIVLLLLVSVITLFSMNVGVFEQRTSANDLRSKIVHQVAEAGVNQGVEYFRLNREEYLFSSGRWVRCGADEDVFPCGAEEDSAKRALMYKYQRASGGGNALESGSLPFDRFIGGTSQVGGFDVSYNVGALLCRIKRPEPLADPDAEVPPAECTTVDADASTVNALTIVAKGQIAGEQASTTVSQTIGAYSLVGNVPETPPILASGTIDVRGTFDVVTNPNSGGFGVPVSVWTRKDTTKGGAMRTCYMDEFLRHSSRGTPVVVDGVTLCDDCECSAGHTLTDKKLGIEGIDILDIDGSPPGENRDVRPEEFPCDLFEYIFGISAWEDTDGDYFCETKRKVAHPTTGAEIGVDELFLEENAKKLTTCRQSDFTGGGLYWVTTPDACSGAKFTIGSPTRPVILVTDSVMVPKVSNDGFKLFGLLFVRAIKDELDPATGGDAIFNMRGGVIYGGVVLQGEVEKANGNGLIVYNEDVLRNLANSPDFIRFGSVPGSWTDRLSY